MPARTCLTLPRALGPLYRVAGPLVTARSQALPVIRGYKEGIPLVQYERTPRISQWKETGVTEVSQSSSSGLGKSLTGRMVTVTSPAHQPPVWTCVVTGLQCM